MHLVPESVASNPLILKLQRDNYNYTIGQDMAFVTFDQQDDWGGVERKTKESRTLKKVDGQWKIMNTSVVDVSSYERRKTGSFHIAKEKLAVDPRTSMRNQHGLGGMAVGYVELPAASTSVRCSWAFLRTCVPRRIGDTC